MDFPTYHVRGDQAKDMSRQGRDSNIGGLKKKFVVQCHENGLVPTSSLEITRQGINTIRPTGWSKGHLCLEDRSAPLLPTCCRLFGMKPTRPTAPFATVGRRYPLGNVVQGPGGITHPWDVSCEPPFARF